jgi:hypothetical protein
MNGLRGRHSRRPRFHLHARPGKDVDIGGISLNAHLVQGQERCSGKRWAMPAGVIDDPKHWRARAGEARRRAAEMPNDMSKQMMLGVAANYDRLAERSELRPKR